MKDGDYAQGFEGGVGKYAPFKMGGHELPGIKQRGVPYTAGDPLNAQMVDGISTTPGKFASSVGSSPAKGFWGSAANIFSGGLSGRIKKRRAKRKAAREAKAAKAAELASANTGDVGAGGDGAHTHGGGGEAMATAGGVGGDTVANTITNAEPVEAPVADEAAAAVPVADVTAEAGVPEAEEEEVV